MSAEETAPTRYLDYNDFFDRKIFRSKMTLWRAIRDHGFPEGVLITPARRVWDEREVNEWIASRPTAPRPGTPNSATA
jgi:predicted DNA-binding transcriptional regulator AlpA